MELTRDRDIYEISLSFNICEFFKFILRDLIKPERETDRQTERERQKHPKKYRQKDREIDINDRF